MAQGLRDKKLMNGTDTAAKSAPEPRPRSVGELKQLLGVTDLSQVSTGEAPPEETTDALDVHEDTRDRLIWKPEHYAEARTTVGPSRLKVTRAEHEALIRAGAVGKPTELRPVSTQEVASDPLSGERRGDE